MVRPTMNDPTAIRDRLLALSHELGHPRRRMAVLGEGNTSADCGDGTFWVKASGSNLATLGPADVSRVRREAALAFLAEERPGEQAIEEALRRALTDPAHAKPSVETFLHAVCLERGAQWVAHAHPESANAILCSRLGAEPFRRHVFPDAVVVCGAAPAVVPYVDPGVELARAVAAELDRFNAEHGALPKVLLMENHGVVTLAPSAREAMNAMIMLDKWARILRGTYGLGGPRSLPDGEVARIDGRLDEHYRRRRLAGGDEP